MLESNTVLTPRTQIGVASWYGPEFQGLPTASGVPFNMEEMTCAHRNLPLGTSIRVTNLRNSKSLVLKVTDRGPYVGNRVLDVSMAAAERLGFMHAGLTHVRIQVVSYPQKTLISQNTPKAFAPRAN